MGLVKYAIWDERDDRHFLMLVDMLFVSVYCRDGHTAMCCSARR